MPRRAGDGELDLGDTYRRGRSAQLAAYGSGGTDQDFAELRAAVAAHRRELRRRAAAWPQEIAGRLEALARLGDLLDEDHELALLVAPHQRKALESLVVQRRQALRAMARPLARRLFAGRPTESAPSFSPMLSVPT
jgi:hypothetical protein